MRSENRTRLVVATLGIVNPSLIAVTAPNLTGMCKKRSTQCIKTNSNGIHRIYNADRPRKDWWPTTKSRINRLLVASFVGLLLSKAAAGISFSVRTTTKEFVVAFASFNINSA